MKKIYLSIGLFLVASFVSLTTLASEKNGSDSILADSKELRTKLLDLSMGYREKKQPTSNASCNRGKTLDLENFRPYASESIINNENFISRSSRNKEGRTNINLIENGSCVGNIEKEEKDYKNDQKDCQYLDYVNGIGNTIYLKPGFVTDIMLPEGERLESIKIGDKLRYEVETFFDRNGRGRWHIYIQPLVWDITTNIIIVTDRHIFQSVLETSEMFIPFVKWELAEDDKEDLGKAANVVLPVKSPKDLEFDYSVTGKAARRIQRCFDDKHWNTFIVFKKGYLKNKKPIVFASSSNGSLVLTDYETNGDTIVVHNVFSILEIHIGNSVAVIRRRKSIT